MECQLSKRLSHEDREKLRNFAGHLLYTIDVAHVIPRSESPTLKHDNKNLVFLNRYSHSMIDSFHDPITGENISKQQKEEWWRRIVGKERYDSLQKEK